MKKGSRSWLRFTFLAGIATLPAPAWAQSPAPAAASTLPVPVAPDPTRDALRKMNTDIGKIVAPEGIDEAGYVTLGGARQWVTIRGQDRGAPVLLYLHGGPGGAISDLSYLFQRPWEDYFTVVQWDQRGFGRSAIDGASLVGTVNKEQYLRDLVELIDHLRGRLGKDKVVILGQSWGSVLSVEIAKRRPDLLHAVAVLGQVTDWPGGFAETKRLLLEDAALRGDTALTAKLNALPKQPSARDYEKFMEWIGAVQPEMEQRGYSWRNSATPEGWGGRFVAARSVSPSLATEPPKADVPFPGGANAARRELIVSIADWSIEKNVGTKFDVPMIVISGKYDWQTPVTLARKYYASICAPYKVYAEFPNSAHVVTIEEPGRTIVTLVNDVLPATRGEVPAGAEQCRKP